MSNQIKLGIALVSIFTAAGCGTNSHSASTVQAERGGGKADSADGSDAALFGCAVDSDCVVIEDDASCADGALVAVNQANADQYCFSGNQADCSIPAAFDTRVAQCDFQAHRCQMIDPTLIHCGGFIAPNHGCPDGFQCDFHGHVPDVGGTCIASTATN